MRLVVLDRDGVINEDSDDYIKSADEWVPIPGSLDAIARLCRADYRVVVVSNQSGVGRGLFTLDTLNKIHIKMLEHVHQKGGELDAILFCPHAPEADCACRKPRPGMLRQLADRLKIKLYGVPAVGDSIRDLEAAAAVHALPVLVKTGKGERSVELLQRGQHEGLGTVPVFDDLAGFAEALLDGELDAKIQALMGGGAGR